MKSNLITKIIVTCLCMWAIGMAADQNQEIKSINEGVKTQVKVEANVELQKKMALKEKALLQTNIKTQQKATAYQNAKKEATMQAERKANAYKYDKKVAATQAERKANAYKYDKKVAATKAQMKATDYQNAKKRNTYLQNIMKQNENIDSNKPASISEPTENPNTNPSFDNRATVEVYFCTDSYPSESSFNICNADGCVWDPNYDASWIGSWACYSEYIDLADGDYTVYADDSYGDGGLCVGVYDPGVGAYAEVCAEGYGSSADFTVGGGAPEGCADGEFDCGDGSCIYGSWACDGYGDCADGSDEDGCAVDCTGYFDCGPDSGPYGQCIYESWACDGAADCYDGSDEADCAPATCEDQGLWDCGDGQCIPTSYVCDGSSEFCNAGWGPDCANGADEGLDSCGYADECAPEGCADGEFDCGDGSCIYGSWACDGYGDCADGSDEADCAVDCTGYFDCGADSGPYGQCIYESWACDGAADCYDGSDEADCGPAECADGEFTCADGSCISGSWACDGYGDCADGSDEADCAPATCEDQGLWDCGDGQCIPTSYVCDGVDYLCSAGWGADCANGADEGLENCDYADECEPEGCADGEFDCGDGNCIYGSWACDGYGDCADGSDEDGCAVDCTGYFDCGADGGPYGQCIYESWACDGAEDCYNGSDEADCGGGGCADGEFTCADGSCIYGSWACDGYGDCADGSDEADCAPASCEDQGLWDCGDGQCIPTSYVCDGSSEFCNAGWGPDCANGADEGLDACGYADECVEGCADGEHDCGADGSPYGQCIYGSWACDGMDDCYDGSDEADCGGSACADGEFDCGADSGPYGQCIYGSWACDGAADCYDGSDEADCGGGSPECEDCEYDWTPYGAECCDTAWDAFGIDCATLEGAYGWDCSGCNCPGDSGEPQTCEELGGLEDCSGDGDCLTNLAWVGDGYCDGTDQAYGFDLTCYDCDGGDCADDCGVCEGDNSTCAVSGCTDSEAYNYNEEATVDDGSCTYVPEGWTCPESYAFDTWCDCGCDGYDSVCDDPDAPLWQNCEGAATCDATQTECVEPEPDDCCGVSGGDNSTCGGSGDVNGGGVDVTDVVAMVSHILETTLLDECGVNDADMTGDGTLNVLDVINAVDAILSGQTGGCLDEAADNYNADADYDDGSCEYSCPEGTVADCDGSGDCFSDSWVGDGLCDGADQNWGADLTCYENDGGDCDACGSYACCGDGVCVSDEAETCPEDCEASEECSACDYDFTPYGAECCDVAWDAFGIDCATLEANYNWDCSGCACPGDVASNCADGEFECGDGSCISGSWACDGYADCADGSDEADCGSEACTDCEYDWSAYGSECCDTAADEFGIDCATLTSNYGWDCSGCNCPLDGGDEGCADGEFDCGADSGPYGQCIYGSWACDGAADCYDGSDEADCGDPASCEDQGLWDCGDGQCIPTSYVCDGSSEFCNAGWPADCANGADEGLDACGYADECAEGCADGEFDCGDGSCIYGSWACDGYGDCADGSDEADCEPEGCADGEFDCGDGSCIYGSWACDGYGDCADGSDEADCAPASCEDQGLWDCGDGQCIPTSYVCDGSSEFCNAGWGPDCANGADEGLDACGYTDDCAAGCADGEHDCGADGSPYGQCIYGSWACDGMDDCYDGSDEADCGGSACADGEFDCGADSGPYGQCIYGSWACDGAADCYDGSDEADCGGRSSSEATVLSLKVSTLDKPVSSTAIKSIEKGLKNPADVIKRDAPLGRKATGFESKLQKASDVKLIKTAEGLSYEADGFVGFEITLTHGADFEIDVTSAGFIAQANTVGNTTKVVVINNETNELFSSTGEYEITNVIAGTANGVEISNVNIVTPKAFGLNNAYPNPFNPTTSVELALPTEGFVSVKIYNLMGQVVATLHEGHLSANTYSFTWDGVDAASGMYLLKAEAAGNVDVQKIMLMK